jgi:hypothetical protein
VQMPGLLIGDVAEQYPVCVRGNVMKGSLVDGGSPKPCCAAQHINTAAVAPFTGRDERLQIRPIAGTRLSALRPLPLVRRDICVGRDEEQCARNCWAEAETSADRLRGGRVLYLQAEPLEDAGQIVRLPAVAQDQSNRDRLRVLARPNVPCGRPKQFLEVVVDVQFLQDCLDQRGRPFDRPGGRCRRVNKPRAILVAPASRCDLLRD